MAIQIKSWTSDIECKRRSKIRQEQKLGADAFMIVLCI